MPTQKGCLCFETPGVTVIRNSYIGEATLSHSAETGSISQFIFSGVIISKAHTMGLQCRSKGRENVSCIGTNSDLHGDGCKGQTNGAGEKKRFGEWTAVIDWAVKCRDPVCCMDKKNVVTCETAQ